MTWNYTQIGMIMSDPLPTSPPCTSALSLSQPNITIPVSSNVQNKEHAPAISPLLDLVSCAIRETILDHGTPSYHLLPPPLLFTMRQAQPKQLNSQTSVFCFVFGRLDHE